MSGSTRELAKMTTSTRAIVSAVAVMHFVLRRVLEMFTLKTVDHDFGEHLLCKFRASHFGLGTARPWRLTVRSNEGATFAFMSSGRQ